MGMQVGERKGVVSEINVVPMADIMLVLLIIMMVVTPFLQSGIAVTLPKGPHGDEDPDINKESAIVVAVPVGAGTIFLAKKSISQDELGSQIQKLIEAKPIDQRVVYVKADNRVPYGDVVRVVEIVRGAGVDRVGLVVDPGKKSSQSQP
jgi:biopolymer transport protein ExbD